jgi:GTP-binding protein
MKLMFACWFLMQKKGITAQDVNIFSFERPQRQRQLFCLVNKWDLGEKSTNTAKEYEKQS